MSRGIFRLKQVYEEQLSGTWSTRGDVWLSPSPFGKAHPFGYFGGGYNPNVLSTVDRIDYSNDTATASVKGPLSLAKWNFSATGNQNFGYYAGGANPSATPNAITSTDRIDYSNDTATGVEKGPLSASRTSFSATSTTSFGYFAGGSYANTTADESIVDRIDYSNDTATAVVKGPLSSDKIMFGAVGNQYGLLLI